MLPAIETWYFSQSSFNSFICSWDKSRPSRNALSECSNLVFVCMIEQGAETASVEILVSGVSGNQCRDLESVPKALPVA